MPVIQNYTANLKQPSGAFAPTTPEMFGSSIGQTVAAVGDKIYQSQVENEQRQILSQTSRIRAKYTALLDQAQLTGGDTSKIKDAMDSELATIGDNLHTPEGRYSLEVHSANTELMYNEQANRVNAVRAVDQAKLDAKQMVDSDSRTLQSNPAYLPFAFANADSLAKTYAGRIAPERLALMVNQIKESHSMTDAYSQGRIDPAATRDKLMKGEWEFLSPENRRMAVQNTYSEEAARRAQEAYSRQLDEIQKRNASNDARSEMFAAIVNNEPPQGFNSIKDAIMSDSRLIADPATQEHLIMLYDKKGKEWMNGEKQSDQAVLRALFVRSIAPDNTPGKLYTNDEVVRAVNAGQLNVRDGAWLANIVASMKDENNRSLAQRVNQYAFLVERSIAGNATLNWDQNRVAAAQTDYMQRAFDLATQLRKEGRPQDMFNPESKDFIGSSAFIGTSIFNVKNKDKAYFSEDIYTKPRAFPDGTIRQWDTKGNVLDSKSWVPIDPAKVKLGGVSAFVPGQTEEPSKLGTMSTQIPQ